MKGIIIIPTYNERDNIKRVIDGIFLNVSNLDILVVDDGSPDGTGKIVKEIMKRDKRVHLIERPEKMGLGTAYIEGFRYALSRGYDFVGEMDADLSHRPSDLKKLVASIKNYDMVVGSRYIKGGSVKNWPMIRRFLSRGANIYARLLTGVSIKDLTAGFVLYRRKVIETILKERIKTDGYGFQIEVKYHVYRKGFKIKEVPIQFEDRKVGRSKMDGKIIFQAFFLVLKLFYKRLKRRIQ